MCYKTQKQGFIFILGLVLLSMTSNAQSFEEGKPTEVFEITYSETFDTWDNQKFYNQWLTRGINTFGADDITDGYLQFTWILKRVIASKDVYTAPYTMEVDLDYTELNNNAAGVVIRGNPDNEDHFQSPNPNDGGPTFNRFGIAFYPTSDWEQMYVQITGPEEDGFPYAQITVDKPDGVASLKTRCTIKIEDYGSSVYVYYNGDPYIRIDLGDKTGGKYTSGTVFNSAMQVAGSFSDIITDVDGKVSVATRAANIRLHKVVISEEKWDGTPDISWYNENQTEFNISTSLQLAGLAELVNIGTSDFVGKTVNLTADITLNDTEDWENWDAETAGLYEWPSIGLPPDNLFNGAFNGHGHVIKGIYVTGNNNQVGLFKQLLADGMIRNVGIEESFLSGRNAVGAIVGLNQGTVENCYNTATIAGSKNIIGGIAGHNLLGVIKNCYNTGTLYGGSPGEVDAFGCQVGGINGWNSGGTVSNSWNSGVVTGAGINIGSIVGDNAEENGIAPVVENSWYLEQTDLPGIDGTVAGEATAKTEAEFESGEVARLLQGEQADLIWGHSALNDGEFPRLATFDDAFKEVFEVSFTVSSEPYAQQYALDGTAVTFPVAPKPVTESDFFAGWEIAGTEVLFVDPVTADVLLSARYLDLSEVTEVPSSNPMRFSSKVPPKVILGMAEIPDLPDVPLEEWTYVRENLDGTVLNAAHTGIPKVQFLIDNISSRNYYLEAPINQVVYDKYDDNDPPEPTADAKLLSINWNALFLELRNDPLNRLSIILCNDYVSRRLRDPLHHFADGYIHKAIEVAVNVRTPGENPFGSRFYITTRYGHYSVGAYNKTYVPEIDLIKGRQFSTVVQVSQGGGIVYERDPVALMAEDEDGQKWRDGYIQGFNRSRELGSKYMWYANRGHSGTPKDFTDAFVAAYEWMAENEIFPDELCLMHYSKTAREGEIDFLNMLPMVNETDPSLPAPGSFIGSLYWAIKQRENHLAVGLDNQKINSNEQIAYPNPTTGKISIVNPWTTAAHIVIYNAKGQTLFNQTFKGDTLDVDILKGYSNGLYFIQIKNSKGESLNSKVLLLKY